MRFTFLLAIALCAGCSSKEHVLGKALKGQLSTILAINSGDAPNKLMLEGTMVEKCPQAGCWFRLDDGTGVIKVDTKEAGFVVANIPLNTKLRVAGLLQQEGTDVQLRALGIAY